MLAEWWYQTAELGVGSRSGFEVFRRRAVCLQLVITFSSLPVAFGRPIVPWDLLVPIGRGEVEFGGSADFFVILSDRCQSPVSFVTLSMLSSVAFCVKIRSWWLLVMDLVE